MNFEGGKLIGEKSKQQHILSQGDALCVRACLHRAQARRLARSRGRAGPSSTVSLGEYVLLLGFFAKVRML